MKKSAVVLFSITALVVFSSVALAGTTPAQKPPVQVTAAAVTVPIHRTPIDLTDEEILAVASPVELSMHALAVRGTAVTTGEVESPEGPDTDGPGGSNHEFDGQETGQH